MQSCKASRALCNQYSCYDFYLVRVCQRAKTLQSTSCTNRGFIGLLLSFFCTSVAPESGCRMSQTSPSLACLSCIFWLPSLDILPSMVGQNTVLCRIFPHFCMWAGWFYHKDSSINAFSGGLNPSLSNMQL